MRHVHRVHCLVEILILGTFELVLVFVDHGVQVDVNCLQRFLLPFGIEVGRPSEFVPGFRGRSLSAIAVYGSYTTLFGP